MKSNFTIKLILITSILLIVLLIASCQSDKDWFPSIGLEVNTDTIRVAPGEEITINYSYIAFDETIEADRTSAEAWSEDTNIVKIISNSFAPHCFEKEVWYNDSLKCLAVSCGESYLHIMVIDAMASTQIPVIVDSIQVK